MKIQNDGGLLIDTEENRCVGYLFDFTDRGIFSPDGKVQVTKEEAAAHNRILAQAEIKGLDENCQIGQGGTFYLNPKVGVTTWTGEKVADYTLNQNQTVVTFSRNGKVFRGRVRKDADCFNFKRIS